jgi:hypothetical protein
VTTAAAPPLACVGCGCTATRACPGGCWWVSEEPLICSACMPRFRGGGLFEQQQCLASLTPATHQPLWVDGISGYCVRCSEGFIT